MDTHEVLVAPRKSKRQKRELAKFNDYVALVNQLVDSDPSSYQKVEQHQIWKDSMVDKYISIIKNDLWNILPRKIDRTIVGSHWIYKIKQSAYGRVNKYKARFMAKWFFEKKGIDYENTFSLLSIYTSIQVVISFATQMG